MSKLCMKLRNEKRKRMTANQKARRQELKEKAIDPKLGDEERLAARAKLQNMPRNGSSVRIGSRCVLTGRSRGVYRKFGLSRNMFRKLALEGKIPGVTKASW